MSKRHNRTAKLFSSGRGKPSRPRGLKGYGNNSSILDDQLSKKKRKKTSKNKRKLKRKLVYQEKSLVRKETERKNLLRLVDSILNLVKKYTPCALFDIRQDMLFVASRNDISYILKNRLGDERGNEIFIMAVKEYTDQFPTWLKF